MVEMGINAVIGLGQGYVKKQMVKAENIVNKVTLRLT
jgi:hypothetical protein